MKVIGSSSNMIGPNIDPIVMELAAPLDVITTLTSGQAHRWEIDNINGSCSTVSGVIGGEIVRIRNVDAGSVPKIEIYSSSDNNRNRICNLITNYFRLDDSIDDIWADISKDQRVKDMIDCYSGLRLLRIDPWECLVSFICSANSNLRRIHQNMESLSSTFGNLITMGPEVRYTFPDPATLAGAGELALRQLGLGFRAPYVAKTAEAIASGLFSLDELKNISYVDAHETLMGLPGVGPKVADCVLLHSLDKLEAFPIDVWMRRALSDWYQEDLRKMNYKLASSWAQNYFGKFAGYAQLFLFHGRRTQVKQVS